MMFRLFAVLLLGGVLVTPPAVAQYGGNIPPKTILANPQTTPHPAAPTTPGQLDIYTIPGGTIPAGTVLGNPQATPQAPVPSTLSQLGLWPIVADNSALKATPTTFAPYVTRADFAAGFGARPLDFKASGSACSLNSGNGDNGSQVKSSDGKCWLASLEPLADVRQWGAKCATDGTNDTVALQAAIDAAKGTGSTTGFSRRALGVDGVCSHTGLVINRPLRIVGTGHQNAYLKLMANSTAPDVLVSCAYDTVNYYNIKGTTCDVSLENIMVGSDDRSNAPGQLVGHGISMVQAATNPVYTRVLLEKVRCIGVPGDCLHGTGGWLGWVEAHNFYFWLPGGYALYANSVTDWQFTQGTLDGAITDNFLCASCYGFRFSQVYIFAAGRHNAQFFGTVDWGCTDCYFDLAGEHGMYVNTAAGSVIRLINPTVRWSSQLVPDGYSDIYFENASAGDFSISAGHFTGSPNPFGSHNLPLWNIYVDNASTMRVSWDAATLFDFGKPGIAGRTVSDVTKTNPPGVVYKDFGSLTNLTSNTSFYFGAGGFQTVAGVGSWIAPSDCVVLGFTLAASVAPGTGQSFAGAVMVNNVAQPMSGSMADATNHLAVASKPVVLSQFDTYQMRVSTSPTAAAGLHSGSLKMFCPA